jgi:site-specific recombinase XerD
MSPSYYPFPSPDAELGFQSPVKPREKSRNVKPGSIRDLLPYYLAYAEHEWHLAPKSVRCYREALERACKILGDIAPQELDFRNIVALKADLHAKHAGAYWTRTIVNSLRSFLRFCQLVLGLQVLDPKAIKLPAIPRRDVVFLTPEEIERFLIAIPVFDKNHRFNLGWLGFRSLVEVLLSTAMRISEALSVKRADINFETGVAQIIGKGNKQRSVFFTPRALGWIKEYVNYRSDDAEWLFVLPDRRPLPYEVVRTRFRTIRRLAGLHKVVTPHILRHTCATTLLFNGCPIGHIKEILGHDRLETTCRYYLGVDKTAAKEAHRKYLSFGV